MNTAEERIDTGADVMDSEGAKVGTVAYVVVHPPEMHVTDIVVSTGFIGRDLIVPDEQIDHIADGKVYLAIDKEALAKLPDYVEVHYEQPPSEWAPEPGFIYPAGSVLWPTANAGWYPEPSSVTVNAPAGTVGISEGMDCESSDGHKVGSVKSVETDPPSGDITAIVIKEGFLFTHDVRIPCSEIKAIQEGRITLNVTKDEAEHKVSN